MKFRYWLLTAVCLFGLGLAWGLTTPSLQPAGQTANQTAPPAGNPGLSGDNSSAPGNISGVLDYEVDVLGQIAKFIVALPKPLMFLAIYLKNVLAIVVSFVFSPVFCLMPVATLLINGGVIGVVAVDVVRKKSLSYLLAGLLPHGIIELPALFIADAASLSFGIAMMLALLNKNKRDSLMDNFRQNLKYMALAAILLLPAAFIETYITPLLMK